MVSAKAGGTPALQFAFVACFDWLKPAPDGSRIPGMKKATAKSREVRAMGTGGAKSMDEYLAMVPEPARSTLQKMRAMIRAAAPAETTEAISYGIPTFKYNGSLVALAAFKNHCSLFPMGSSVLAGLADEIKDYQVSKGTLHFPVDKPMPARLVKKIVKLRVAQNESKKRR
jgi:uncharacterized protein YdhG (YjbR/CyaY superfamily)